MIILKIIVVVIAFTCEVLAKCLYAVSSMFMDVAIMLLGTVSDSKEKI